MNRVAHTFALLILGLLIIAATTSASPKRVDIDKRFGSNGWVKVPNAPKNRWTTILSCTAGKSGNSLTAAQYSTGSSILLSLTSRGQRNKHFGTHGLLRFGPNEVPVEITRAAHRRWLVSFWNRAQASWKLVRFNSNGRRDTSFGIGGELGIPGDAEGADYEMLTNGGLVVYQSSSAQILSADGRPQAQINGNGLISVPFTVTSVFEMKTGKFLVVGKNNDQLMVTMLEPDGAQTSTWNNGTPLQLEPAPDSSWKPVLERAYDPPRAYTSGPPSWISPVREIAGAIELHYGFVARPVDSDSERQNVTLRLRLLPSGEFDSRLSGNGWAFWSGEFVDYEPSLGDDTLFGEVFYLPDGRKVSANFHYGSEQTPGSRVTFGVSDRSERFSTRGARKILVNRLRFSDYSFDAAGKNLIVCGIRDYFYPVVGRVRL